jgi:hypothetical protein
MNPSDEQLYDIYLLALSSHQIIIARELRTMMRLLSKSGFNIRLKLMKGELIAAF